MNFMQDEPFVVVLNDGKSRRLRKQCPHWSELFPNGNRSHRKRSHATLGCSAAVLLKTQPPVLKIPLKIFDGRPSTAYSTVMETTCPKRTVSAASLRKVQKQSVSDDVETQLRGAILSGAIAAGETLAEAQLAAQLGVSRASVRQAKFQLSQEGLLEFDSRGTARVRTLTEQDVREIVEFREVLDVAAVRLATTRITPQQIAKLESLIDQIQREPDLLQLTMLDIAFHDQILQAAANSRLLAAWQLLRPQLQLWLAGMHRLHNLVVADTQDETARSHQQLLEAIQSGDCDLCEQLARSHANGLRSRLIDVQATPQSNGASDE